MSSYLLKVTKFLGKISLFEFLVMTEKNIFVYKLFFVIKYLIPHVIFQTTSQFFFKFFMTLVSWNIFLCTFLGQTLYTLQKRNQSKCNVFILFSAQIKIHQILVISETKNKFFFKFCTTHSVHWGINPPSKIPLPSFLPRPPLNQQTVQAAPFLGNPPPL